VEDGNRIEEVEGQPMERIGGCLEVSDEGLSELVTLCAGPRLHLFTESAYGLQLSFKRLLAELGREQLEDAGFDERQAEDGLAGKVFVE
jgi:hypothetical protein